MNARDIFAIWREDLDGTNRFLYKERKDNIENLVSDLYGAGVPIEEVRFLKNDVMTTLITRDGMKNTGKYKGWKDNVSNDFDTIVASIYLTSTLDSLRNLNKINSKHHIKMNQTIINWLYNQYSYVSKRMLAEAHTPGSFLNSVFLRDYKAD